MKFQFKQFLSHVKKKNDQIIITQWGRRNGYVNVDNKIYSILCNK
jgi:hypothetical protein